MPELPEVETIKLHLDGNILNKKITKIEVIDKRIVEGSVEILKKELKGKKFKKIERIGKALIFDISKNLFVFAHLRMTGQLVYQKGKREIYGGHPIENIHSGLNKFTCVVFNFEDDSRLFFNCVRKFSRLKLMDLKEKEKYENKIGIDPMGRSFTIKKFLEIIENKNTAVKPFLLDQKYIAGIGNIYADEICFFAGILPSRHLNSLSLEEKKKIFQGITKILKKSILKGGTTFRNYRNAEGGIGGFSAYLKVYGRKMGEKCQKGVCVGKISKKRVGGRNTSYCSICQK